MDKDHLQRYLHDRIPLSKTMGVAVVEAAADGVELSAPLAPNVNHHGTGFGGSAAALALLSAWALVQLRLDAEGIESGIVVRRTVMTYERPITGDFTARSALKDPAGWREVMDTLKRKGRAKIPVSVVLRCKAEPVATLEGEFVASSSSPPA